MCLWYNEVHISIFERRSVSPPDWISLINSMKKPNVLHKGAGGFFVSFLSKITSYLIFTLNN